MQIATQGVITNEYDEVLLIQRNDTRTMAAPGGSVESGELPIDGVAREVKEETGIIVMPTRLVGLYFWPTSPAGILVFVFRCLQRGGELAPSEEAIRVGFHNSRSLPGPMISFHRRRLQRALRHNGGPPEWGTDATSWWLRPAKFLLFNVIYRFLDIKRSVLQQPPYQPPPNWSTSAFTIIRNETGQVLWVKNVTSGMWALPGGPSAKMIPPWETATYITKSQSGLSSRLTDLAAVYTLKGEDRMEFVFTAVDKSAGVSEKQGMLEIAYFTPGKEPASCVPRHVTQVADACDRNTTTVFRLQE